jgi:hypothetical protein
MSCRCEPNASGSNRCAFCLAEREINERGAPERAELRSAVALIQLLASGCDEFSPQFRCDSWLENNGYECEASRRKARELRAANLDAEIARLRAEREKL